MALPLDSLTLTHGDVGRDDTGSSLGASMPGFAPLAMPAQSFWRFSRRDRRQLAAPRLAGPPILTRLAVFGGAVALTAYGADQMFRVVSIGAITPLEWVIAVLFVITFSWITLSFIGQHRRLCLAARASGPARAARSSYASGRRW